VSLVIVLLLFFFFYSKSLQDHGLGLLLLICREHMVEDLGVVRMKHSSLGAELCKRCLQDVMTAEAG
jgi:hypothetical protein